jgi:hypothetical protein
MAGPTSDVNQVKDTGESALSHEAYKLLAHANLLRIRGQWDEAIEQCMAAMRLAPGNASAQSLLGDIYENRGQVDDAIQWYRMALDVNPDSGANKLKLERLVEAKARKMKEPLDFDDGGLPGPGARPQKPRKPRAGDPLIIDRAPDRESLVLLKDLPLPNVRMIPVDRVLRATAFASALVFAIVILLGVVVARSRPRRPSTAGIPVAPLIVRETGSDAGKRPISPIHMPARDGARDLAEAVAFIALRNNLDLSNNGLKIVDVLLDPRDHHLNVTVSSEVLPSAGRDYFLTQTLRVFRAADGAAGAADPDISTMSVFFLSAPTTGPGAGTAKQVFAADMNRPFLFGNRDLSTLTPTESEAALYNMWPRDMPQ